MWVTCVIRRMRHRSLLHCSASEVTTYGGIYEIRILLLLLLLLLGTIGQMHQGISSRITPLNVPNGSTLQ